jgi:hypothetical protein
LYLAAPSVLLLDMAARVTLSEFSVCEERPPYTFGLAPAGSAGGGAERRTELFEAFAARLAEIFGGLFDMPAREAWAEANEIVEGPGINWAYTRKDGARSFTARGSC